jgi:hypothetical protein
MDCLPRLLYPNDNGLAVRIISIVFLLVLPDCDETGAGAADLYNFLDGSMSSSSLILICISISRF